MRWDAQEVVTSVTESAARDWARDLRNSFFAGLVVILPVAASVGILLWLFNLFTGWLVPGVWREADGTVPFPYRVIALALFLALMIGLGWLTRRVAGRELVKLVEQMIARVPLLNKTYEFATQVRDMMLGGTKSAFERVVVVEYPRPGIYTLAFATQTVGGESRERTGAELVSVFLPTPPNPTTGYLVLFPRAQVVELEMSVADAMKMSFSGGAVVPPYPVRPT